MIKAGVSNSSNKNMTDVQYLGEETGFKPQMELAKYLAMLGLQKKTQADDRYGGFSNAQKLGFGMFGYNPFKNAAEAEYGPPPEPKKAPVGTTGTGPGVEPPPAVGPDGNPIKPPGTTPPPTTPPPGGDPPPGGGPPATQPPKGGTRAPINDVPMTATVPPPLPPNPTPEELAALWAKSGR